MKEENAKAVWREADAVCFDVDSTVCVDEGVDELATYLGKGEQVAQLTQQAMGGSMTFRESLVKRLGIIQPSQQDLARFIADHPPQLTDGIKELVTCLQSSNVPVYLVSGGFQTIIEPIADCLAIPRSHIFANRLLFYNNGEYGGFDSNQPTSEAGGKPRLMEMLKKQHGYQRLVHVGDGVTDMEASPPADAFIGFGANQVREKVRQGAPWFVTSFQELISEFKRGKQE